MPSTGRVRGSPLRAPRVVSSSIGNPVIKAVNALRPPVSRHVARSMWCSARARNQATGGQPAARRTKRSAAFASA
jgi:hypothetical protein